MNSKQYLRIANLKYLIDRLHRVKKISAVLCHFGTCYMGIMAKISRAMLFTVIE